MTRPIRAILWLLGLAVLAALRLTFEAASITAPPFISKPRRAPVDSAEAIEAGTEMTSAQGQPMSRSASPR